MSKRRFFYIYFIRSLLFFCPFFFAKHSNDSIEVRDLWEVATTADEVARGVPGVGSVSLNLTLTVCSSQKFGIVMVLWSCLCIYMCLFSLCTCLWMRNVDCLSKADAAIEADLVIWANRWFRITQEIWVQQKCSVYAGRTAEWTLQMCGNNNCGSYLSQTHIFCLNSNLESQSGIRHRASGIRHWASGKPHKCTKEMTQNRYGNWARSQQGAGHIVGLAAGHKICGQRPVYSYRIGALMNFEFPFTRR